MKCTLHRPGFDTVQTKAICAHIPGSSSYEWAFVGIDHVHHRVRVPEDHGVACEAAADHKLPCRPGSTKHCKPRMLQAQGVTSMRSLPAGCEVQAVKLMRRCSAA